MAYAKFAFILFVTLSVGLGTYPHSVGAFPSQANRAASDGSWVSFGPTPIMNCFGGPKVDPACSGRVSSIAIDPRNPNTIYIGAASGGVWKSTDNGATWTPLMDSLTNSSLNVGALAIDPNGVVYVGTGEGDWPTYGSGVLKSTDGGKTWMSLGTSTFGRSAFTKIAVDPKDPNKIFATTNYGTTGGSYSDPRLVLPDPSGSLPLGIFVSIDGGNSWTLSRRTQSTTIDNGAWDVIIDPTNSSIIYASADGGVYVSSDAGSTWSGPLTGGFPNASSVGRISLGISASSHRTLYAAIQYLEPNGSSDGRLYRTMDGGSTWSRIGTPIPAKLNGTTFCGDQCDYDLYIAVDPTDPNTLYLGGLNLYRSTDGGAHWTDLGGYAPSSNGETLIHVDQHALAFSPTSHTTIYIGNDGGAWSSTQANTCQPASCWTDLNSGLGITQFYSIAVDPTNSTHLLGGTQDNGCMSHTGLGLTWVEDDNCGDGGWTAFNPKNPRTMYETEEWSALNDSAGFLYRSDNGGSGWNVIDNGLNATDQGNFLVPLAIDPTNPSTLYLGTTNLYKSTNEGDNWTMPTPGLSFPTPDTCEHNVYSRDCISAIAVAPSSGDYVYVGTNTGHFYASTDGANHFVEADASLPKQTDQLVFPAVIPQNVPQRVPVTYIVVDPHNPKQVYVTFSGFGNGHVFSSSNEGSTWSDISSDLPDYPVNTIALSPDGSWIFVGTDRGVYASLNGGLTWAILGTNLPRVPVMDLKFGPNGNLWAATWGRGVWMYSFKQALTITFANMPAAAIITIDGTVYNGTILRSTPFEWNSGSTHSLQVSQVEPGPPGVRYVFVKWSDGSTDLSRTLNTTMPGDYSPIFTTQDELDVLSGQGNPQGAGWYDAGATATISVTSPTPAAGLFGLLGATSTFLHWTDASTATTPMATITVDQPKSATAAWSTDYTRAYTAMAVIVAISIFALAVILNSKRARP